MTTVTKRSENRMRLVRVGVAMTNLPFGDCLETTFTATVTTQPADRLRLVQGGECVTAVVPSAERRSNRRPVLGVLK